MEAKQYATNQPVNHWRNKKIPIDKWKHDNPKPMGFSNTVVPKETGKISNKEYLKQLEKEEQIRSKVSRRKNIKISLT